MIKSRPENGVELQKELGERATLVNVPEQPTSCPAGTDRGGRVSNDTLHPAACRQVERERKRAAEGPPGGATTTKSEQAGNPL